jgi:acetoin utilization deacetylase AcuC-like enzyme
MLIIHSSRCLEYAGTGHPETPERVAAAVTALKNRHNTWLEPEPCSERDILRVHSAALLNAVKTGQFFDADTPYFPNIYELARLAAGAAILAAEKAIAGQTAFSLMRPPGHHAERGRIMGFCYLNNIAIAVARTLSDSTVSIRKVAILDFDCHHGNGTEDVFYGAERVLFASLHQSPCYPGTGLVSRKNCLNYPLRPGTGPREFLAAFDEVLEKLCHHRPDMLAVSAGFDSYKGDPITAMELEIDTFHEIGARIVSFCQTMKGGTGTLPCFMVLEGGYSRDFARCVESFVNAWSRWPELPASRSRIRDEITG